MVRLKNSAPMEVIVISPQSESGQRELALRVAEAHADFVLSTIDTLPCPTKQKQELLQAVMDTVRGTYPALGRSACDRKEGSPPAVAPYPCT